MDRNWEITPFWNGAQIIQPLLFISGDQDGVHAMTKDAYGALDVNAQRLVAKHLIEGAGHWIQQERPKEANKLLYGFLTSS